MYVFRAYMRTKKASIMVFHFSNHLRSPESTHLPDKNAAVNPNRHFLPPNHHFVMSVRTPNHQAITRTAVCRFNRSSALTEQ